MRRRHLAVDHTETARFEFLAQSHKRDFRCVALTTEHGFAEENASNCNSVKAADELIVEPSLNGMRIAQVMQLHVSVTHFSRNPGAFGTELAIPARAND